MRACSSRIRFLLAATALAGLVSPAAGFTPIFQENFDSLPLGPPVDEDFLTPFFPEAFTHIPPQGWNRQASSVPGVGNPFVGVEEWEGWSFADRDFWIAAAAGTPFESFAGGRERFDLGSGTIAVADPDQWNDLGNPANTQGFYQTLLQTPSIDLALRQPNEDRLVLQFASSWRGGCCDDGAQFDPGGNNQTASVYVRIDNGPRIPLLRWESAPFLDQFGEPTSSPVDPIGNPNTPNPNFKQDNFNELVQIDLTGLLEGGSGPNQPPQGSAFGSVAGVGGGAGAGFTGSGAAAGGLMLEFEMEEAGDDGFWGLDEVEVVSLTTVLGDMDLNGFVDMDDIDDFAEGMLDTTAYRFSHYGEFPGTRGSVDSSFDFDDAAWFVGLFPPSSSASSLLSEALRPTPEPTAATLTLLAAALVAVRRRSGLR